MKERLESNPNLCFPEGACDLKPSPSTSIQSAIIDSRYHVQQLVRCTDGLKDLPVTPPGLKFNYLPIEIHRELNFPVTIDDEPVLFQFDKQTGRIKVSQSHRQDLIAINGQSNITEIPLPPKDSAERHFYLSIEGGQIRLITFGDLDIELVGK